MNYFDAIIQPIHWWKVERWDRGVDPHVDSLLIFLFETLDALRETALQIPDEWAPPRQETSSLSGTHSMVISTPIPIDKLVVLRASITLVGDVFVISRTLCSRETLELADPIEDLRAASGAFRDLRNFYTHLDERLTDMDKHGITGRAETPFATYTESARGCFHLVLLGNTLYFTDQGAAKETSVSRASFEPVFEAARSIYAKITSHEMHARAYPSPESIYPPLG